MKEIIDPDTIKFRMQTKIRIIFYRYGYANVILHFLLPWEKGTADSFIAFIANTLKYCFLFYAY